MPKQKKTNSYQRILKYIKPYKYRFIVSIALAIGLSFLAPLRPLWIQKTIEDYIQKGAIAPYLSKTIWSNELVQAIIWITVLQIGLILMETLLRFIFSFTSAWLGQNIVKDLRLEVYKKIMSYKISQFDTTPVGTLSTRTINDIEAINSIFSEGFVPILADVLSISIVLISMFYVNWQLALISLAPFPVLLFATYFFKESVKKSFQKVRLSVAQLNTFVQEHLSGMSFIQTFNLQEQELEKFKRTNSLHKNANVKAIFAYSVFFPIVEITAAVSISFLIYASIYTQVNASILVFYFLSLNQIFRPLRFIADKFNVIQMGMVASERVFAILDNTEILEDDPTIHTHLKEEKIKGKIVFQDVSFFYKPEKQILHNINFTVEAGEKIALVGPTGNGKSTIVSLLNRMYQHQSGIIEIDNKKIEDYNLTFLRSQIGVILQDVFLFSGSIRQNLTLNNPDISEEQMLSASRLLGLHDTIMKLPNGYDFHVMERGTLLSVGQRQLISFTRMMLYNPQILIMDEATSSIDTESEILIQNALEQLIQNRTSILVAHRLSTIQKADKILFIKNGTIAEQGRHAELVAQKGLYYNLYNSITQE